MGRQWLRRPSPALVVSVIALVAALGSGAYAAVSGIPDALGVFHGCVNNRTGVVRVVKSAKSCAHRRVLRRGGKRIVIPGELAIAWSQQGPRGLQGIRGTQGPQGNRGTQGNEGPGATSFATTIAEGPSLQPATLVNLNNGLTLSGSCTTLPAVQLHIEPGADVAQGSGTASLNGNPPTQFDFDSIGAKTVGATSSVDFDVIARDATTGSGFVRIDAHGTFGNPCRFWGMITPSS
jgi:hypothetical protein